MSGIANAIQNVPTIISSTLDQIEPTYSLTRDYLTTPLKALASTVQTIWETVKPYLVAFAQFMTSQTGISLELLGLSFIPLKIAQGVDDRIISTALTAAGILIAGTGGFMLNSSGALSSFLTTLSKALPL